MLNYRFLRTRRQVSRGPPNMSRPLTAAKVTRRLQVRRRPGMRIQEQIDEQRLDGRRIMADLVIARRHWPAQFQPVERRFGGNRQCEPFLISISPPDGARQPPSG